MLNGKTIRWHRPEESFELGSQFAELSIDGTPTRIAFPLFVRVADKPWALGVPLDQLRKPDVDVYVFHYSTDGDTKSLSPAGEDGFDALQRELSDPDA